MIIRFDQDTPVELAGCKGNNLSRMFRAGLPVPRGVCVTYGEPGNGLNRALAELNAGSFAVRSSAVHEDACDASFAGMLLSRLNVPADDVPSTLEDIWKSASDAAAASYSQRLDVPRSARTAAVVQEFIPAEASGVLFTQDPQTGERHRIVEGSWGLGPGVVEGLVRPDRWVVREDGTVISSIIADKDIAIAPAGRSGITQVPVDPSCRRRPCLNPESLKQLSRLAAECERLFARPQDIEWALFDNQVWLLQSRPITRLHK